MKDFLGNELAVGDTVVCTPNNNKKMLVKATITAFTPMQVRVEYIETCHAYKQCKDYVAKYIIYPNVLIKIPLTS